MAGKLGRTLIALGLGVSLAGAAPPATLPGADAPAPEPPPAVDTKPVPRVNLTFDKTDIADVIMLLKAQTGANFVVGEGVSGSVTATFTDKPLDAVWRLLGLTLGLKAEKRGSLYLLKKEEPAAPADATGPQPAAGAAALLPGVTPVTPLQEPGGAPAALVGQGDGKGTKETIQKELTTKNPRLAATIFGGKWVDKNGITHTADELQAMAAAGNFGAGAAAAGGAGRGQQQGGDPWANLPPDAKVTANGTILMPDGRTILPNGIVIMPNGTTVMPQQQTPNIQVPWGWNPNQVQQQQFPQQQGVLGGTLAGIPFGVAADGTTVINPGNTRLGGTGLQLGPIVIGGNNGNVNMGAGNTQMQLNQPQQLPNGQWLLPNGQVVGQANAGTAPVGGFTILGPDGKPLKGLPVQTQPMVVWGARPPDWQMVAPGGAQAVPGQVVK